MKNTLKILLACLCPAFCGELSVKMSFGTINRSLQALADAQVFTKVSPEKSAYKDQKMRFRVKQIVVSPGPKPNQLKWDITALYEWRPIVHEVGEVKISGVSEITAKLNQPPGLPAELQIYSCFPLDNIVVNSFDPIIRLAIDGLQASLKGNEQLLGKLDMCIDKAYSIEKYVPALTKTGVKSIIPVVTPADGSITVNVSTIDSPKIKSTNSSITGVINFLLD